MASLGTAQRLAPVHSGLPLCETCLSSPTTETDTNQAIFPTALSNQNIDDGGFVVQEPTAEEKEKLHLS